MEEPYSPSRLAYATMKGWIIEPHNPKRIHGKRRDKKLDHTEGGIPAAAGPPRKVVNYLQNNSSIFLLFFNVFIPLLYICLKIMSRNTENKSSSVVYTFHKHIPEDQKKERKS